MQVHQVMELAKSVSGNVGKVIVGKHEVVELLLAAVFSGGHVLLEDVPGTGKTLLAKSLSKSLDCRFARIQFTPDLLPADITGMSMYNQKTSEFEFTAGPVFTNILLADEINRATPRTQSALLECMEERQVTVDGQTYPLKAPFLVIATQNPVETQGTFPLPEAQLDRFLLRMKMGYPSAQEAKDILSRFMWNSPLQALAAVADGATIIQAQECCQRVEVSEPVLEYIVALAEKTRQANNVLLGVSPRGMLALMRASQALAAIRGRHYVTPDDVRTLAVPVLAHRMVVRGAYGKSADNETVIRELVSSTPVPTENPERG